MAAKKRFSPVDALKEIEKKTTGRRAFEKFPAVRQACKDFLNHLDAIGFKGKIKATDLMEQVAPLGFKGRAEVFRNNLKSLDPVRYKKYFGKTRSPKYEAPEPPPRIEPKPPNPPMD